MTALDGHALPPDALALVALDAARTTGLLDALFEGPVQAARMGPILSHLLVEGGVAERTTSGDISLLPTFRDTWQDQRTDLDARLAFTRRALVDIVTRLETLCFDLPSFMGDSATFQLFRYDRAMTESAEDIAHTRQWVSYVEALSRQEAPCLAGKIDLSNSTRLLEIGGNTGLMCEALLAVNSRLQAVVMDLPAVCFLGRERAARVSRLSFVAADARQVDWRETAGPIDAILFKSVLHDWPEREATAFLDKAVRTVPKGGRVIVAERGSIRAEAGQGLRGPDAANMVFAPFFRDPLFYVRALEQRGLRVERCDLRIDMGWHVITGVRV